MEKTEQLSKKQIYSDILRYMMPCLIELLLAQLVSMIDMMMVGGLGTKAINAVGVNMNPTLLLVMIFSALNVGTTALVSRAKGEGDRKKINQIVRQALLITGVVGVAMTAIGFILSEQLIAMMGVENADTAEMAVAYLRWRLIGVIPIGFSSAIAAALRGVGNARTAMYYNLFGNAANVLFNWLLIQGVWIFPEMKVAGAALATSIGQTLSMVIAFAVLFKGSGEVKLDLRERFVFDRGIFSNMITIGMPAMAEQVVFRIAMILFGRMTVSLGEVDYAAHQICWNILNFVLLIGQSMQMATAPITGQCVGRNDTKRAEVYNRHAFLLLFVAMTACGLMCNIFSEQLMMLFSPEPDVLKAGLPVLRIFGASLPILAVQCTYNGALQGAGDTKFNAPIFLLTTICIRLPVAMLFKDVFGWGLVGVNSASIVDQIVRAALFYARYKTGKWKTIKLKQ